MASTRASRTVDVTQLIDAQPLTRFHARVVGLCALVAVLDGMDTQVIGVAAPAIAANLGMPMSAFGPVFSAALLGAMVGAFAMGPIADRIGRKATLIAATLVFAIFTFLTAFATSFESLVACRFLVGLGLGGATPCFLALPSEYAPKHLRATLVSLVWAGFPLGIMVGGFVASYLLGFFDWHALFYVGGLLPLLAAGALAVWLPESLKFLLARGGDARQVEAIVRQVAPGTPPDAKLVAHEEKLPGVPVRHLFTEGRLATTLLLWVPFFMAFGTLIVIVLWTPALLRANGMSVASAATVVGFHGLGSFFGMASAGRLLERYGPMATLLPAFVIGAACTAALGTAGTSVALAALYASLAGVFLGFGASGVVALSALAYPTAIRSTGIGWAMGMGRLGQVFSPLVAGALLGAGQGVGGVFLAFGIAPLIAAVAVLALRWQAGARGHAADETGFATSAPTH